MDSSRPVGTVTRGTTNPNRLRRMDRWLVATQLWRLRGRTPAHPDDLTTPTSADGHPAPVVVDLGYGASPVTAVELHRRLTLARPDVHVVGLEIDPARVAAGRLVARPGLSFHHGGFEVPLPDGGTADVIRAANVLRQYDEEQVPTVWGRLQERLTPHGILVDGTCDEIGRRHAWVTIERAGPVSLTLSLAFGGFDTPSDVAERLPKVLIHRNVPGEAIHRFLRAADTAWARAAPLASYGRRQRFVATCRDLKASGWPVLHGPSRWRLGELGVTWEAVRPNPR